jgi:hypothetical protein
VLLDRISKFALVRFQRPGHSLESTTQGPALPKQKESSTDAPMQPEVHLDHLSLTNRSGMARLGEDAQGFSTIRGRATIPQ